MLFIIREASFLRKHFLEHIADKWFRIFLMPHLFLFLTIIHITLKFEAHRRYSTFSLSKLSATKKGLSCSIKGVWKNTIFNLTFPLCIKEILSQFAIFGFHYCKCYASPTIGCVIILWWTTPPWLGAPILNPITIRFQ